MMYVPLCGMSKPYRHLNSKQYPYSQGILIENIFIINLKGKQS